MDLELLLLFLHIIGATVLLGTGAGIAFFMVISHKTGNAELIAHTASTVVLADTIFTATAVVVQPVTGYLLAQEIGWDLTEGWILLSLILYVITGLFWLPVVWIQIRLRDLARKSSLTNTPLPESYYNLYRTWFACGFPAFASVLAIIWLMLAKPSINLL